MLQEVICFQQNQREEVRNMGDCSGAIVAGGGMHNTNFVVYTIDALTSNSMKSKNPHSGIHETQVSKCLDTMCLDPSCNQGGHIVLVYDGSSVTSPKNWNNPQPGDPCYALHTDSRNYVVIALEGNGARPSHMGNGYSESGTMYTLNTIEQHSVCYDSDRQG